MAISEDMKLALGTSSLIRKMFEEGNLLKKQYGPDKVFDFSLGNPDIDPPQAFRDTLIRLASGDTKGSHGYMTNSGFPFVREALAKKTSAEHKVSIDGSHIVMSVGAAGGLNTVFKTLCNPADEIIISKPYFVEYRSYTANYGAKLVEVNSLPDFNLDLNAIKEALGAKTKIVLINSPNNPTGRIYPAKALSELADLLREHGKKTGSYPYLVSDEPYREIAYGVEVPPVLSVYSETIAVNSYSKSLSIPGERIGYIAVSPDISEKDQLVAGLSYATRILGYVNAPALMQRVVAELINEKADVRIYAKRRDAFMKVLNEAGIEYARPDGAFYLFAKVPPKNSGSTLADDTEFVNHLKKFLIIGVPGASFGAPSWVRFAYCVDENIIRTSGEAFKQAMANWRNSG
jgi:aspartate aminotransferase